MDNNNGERNENSRSYRRNWPTQAYERKGVDTRMNYADFKEEVNKALEEQGMQYGEKSDAPLTATELKANDAIGKCYKDVMEFHPGLWCRYCPEKRDGKNCPNADRWYTMHRRAQKLKKKQEQCNIKQENVKQSYLDNRVKVHTTDRGEYMDYRDGSIVNKLVGNGTDAFDEAKSAMIEAQVGAATLTAVKAALVKLPLPEAVKNVLELDGYGDLLTGFVLKTVACSVSDNDNVAKAARAANIVGAMRASDQITIIQDVINSVVAGVVGATDSVMGAVGTQVPTGDVEASDNPEDE